MAENSSTSRSQTDWWRKKNDDDGSGDDADDDCYFCYDYYYKSMEYCVMLYNREIYIYVGVQWNTSSTHFVDC